jgi:hypothetical protein
VLFHCGEVYKGANAAGQMVCGQSPPCASNGQERSQMWVVVPPVPGVSMLQWRATVSHSSSGACAKAHTIEHSYNVVEQQTVTLAAQQTRLVDLQQL